MHTLGSTHLKLQPHWMLSVQKPHSHQESVEPVNGSTATIGRALLSSKKNFFFTLDIFLQH